MRLNIQSEEIYVLNSLEQYTQHLRAVNRIVCSFSRYDAFVAALDEMVVAEKYSVVPQSYCAHNMVYVSDEEGIFMTYILDDELETK